MLRLYKDQQIVERRHRDMKQTLKVRPIFLHNDDRVYALLSIVGISLLIFGLIEAQTRAALGPDQQLPGLLPEGRAARPTGRNILAAFQGLGLTYTHTGIQLDPLTDTQQHILDLLEIQPPWPTQADHALTNCGMGPAAQTRAPFPDRCECSCWSDSESATCRAWVGLTRAVWARCGGARSGGTRRCRRKT